MRVRWLAGALVAAGFSVGACGSTSDGGGGTGGISIDELPPLLAKGLCAAYERCLGPLAAGTFVAQDCVGQQTKAFEDGGLEELRRAVESGKATYDETKAGACIDAIEKLSCANFDLDSLPECNAAVKGTVPDGGDCESANECAETASYCKVEAACPGKCTPRSPAGAECDSDESCAAGLECTGSGQTCARPALAGEACDGEGSPSCQIGLACVGADETGTPGRCTDPDDIFSEAVGKPCDLEASTLCKIGASCVVTAIDAGGLVMECKDAVASGAPCNLGAPDICPNDEVCDLTVEQLMQGTTEGKCRPLPTAGQACSEAFGAPECSVGNTCVEGQCVAIQRIGGKCSDDAACYSSSCVSGTCQASDSCAP